MSTPPPDKIGMHDECFICKDELGVDGEVNVITQIQRRVGIFLEYKQRTLTMCGGICINLGTESDWIEVL